jgi:hypothetical protein
MVALLVEVSHTNLSEITGMVFIHVGSVVMLTTSETTTTRMLAAVRMSVNVRRPNCSNSKSLLHPQS